MRVGLILKDDGTTRALLGIGRLFLCVDNGMGNETALADVHAICKLLLSTRFLCGWHAKSLTVLGRCHMDKYLLNKLQCGCFGSFKHDGTDDGTAPAVIRPARHPPSPIGLITDRAVPSSFSMTVCKH